MIDTNIVSVGMRPISLVIFAVAIGMLVRPAIGATDNQLQPSASMVVTQLQQQLSSSTAALLTSISSSQIPPTTTTTMTTTAATTTWKADGKVTITIGLMMPSSSSDMKQQLGFGTSASAVTIAVDLIRSENLLPNVEFK